MDCKDAEQQMSNYIEEEITEEEKKIFEEHMQSCNKCEAEFCKFEKIIRSLKNVKDVEPSYELKSKIIGAISKENKKMGKILPFKIRKISYVAVIIMALIGTYYLLEQNTYNENLKSEMAQKENSLSTLSENSMENTEGIQTYGGIQRANINKNTSEKINLYEGIIGHNEQIKNFEHHIILEKGEFVYAIFKSEVQNDVDIYFETEKGVKLEQKRILGIYNEIVYITSPSNGGDYVLKVETNDDKYIKGTLEVSVHNPQNEKLDELYSYEQNIEKSSSKIMYEYKVPLKTDETCYIYFENKSRNNAIVYIEDEKGNLIQEEIMANKNTSIIYFIPPNPTEINDFVIKIVGENDSNIEGYFKIQALQK